MIAFLYPGQGAQHPGMLSSLAAGSQVTETLSTVSGVLGHDVMEFDSPEALRDTVAAQVALLTVGVALTRVLADEEISPDVVLGHSIGAFAAGVAAGVLTLQEAVSAVILRAEGMRDLYPSGFGLLAVLGSRLREARKLVDAVSAQRGAGELFIAMENAEDQIVLAGSDGAFVAAEALAPSFGVRETRRLDVAVPSHCSLLSPVSEAVDGLLRTLPVRQPILRYVSAMTARSALTADAVLRDLSGGVSHMVKWRDATDLLEELGVSAVVQVSPGHTTAALFTSAHPSIPTIALDYAPLSESIARTHRIVKSIGIAGG